MKREAIIAISALLTFWGCTKSGDLPFENSSKDTDKISLNVVNTHGDQLSRGSVVDTEEKMTSVGMYCAHTIYQEWNTSTAFNKMSNNKFGYSNEKWVWDVADNDGKEQPIWGHTSMTNMYTFFAYSPHTSDVADNRLTAAVVSAQPELTFTVASTVAEQEDLMAAIPRKNIYPQSGGRANMEFDHALTKVSFAVKGVRTRKIKSITAKGVSNQGKLKFTDDEPNFAWSNQSGTQDYTVSTESGNNALLDVVPNDDETKATPITSESGYLFMIPQDIAGKTLDVVITDADGTNPVVETLTFPAESKWTQSKHINYMITLEQNEVDLSFTFLDWDEELVDAYTKGTYLNILDNSIGIFDGGDALIYYATDHTPDSEVTATFEKVNNSEVNGSLKKNITEVCNYFLFSTYGLDYGEYVVTINAGTHLSRKLKITLEEGTVKVDIIPWDDVEQENNTHGDRLTLSHNEVNLTPGEMFNLYYSTTAKSVSSNVDNAKILISESSGLITLRTTSDIETPSTATLEIRADNMIRKVKINIK